MLILLWTKYWKRILKSSHRKSLTNIDLHYWAQRCKKTKIWEISVEDFGLKSLSIHTYSTEKISKFQSFPQLLWSNSKSIYFDNFSFLKFLLYENVRRFEIHEIARSALAKNEEAKKSRIESNSNIKVYSDITAFRKKMQLYPDYYSHLWKVMDWKKND